MTTRRNLLAIVVALAILAGCALQSLASDISASGQKSDGIPSIVYRPIGSIRGSKPECGHPYTVTVWSTGRVLYVGSNCVREIGPREMTIPPDIATDWVNRLINAGFFPFLTKVDLDLQTLSSTSWN